VDIPLESIIERSSFKVAEGAGVVSRGESWDEVRLKLEAYLQAWFFSYRPEEVSEILARVRERASGAGRSRTELAIDEADKLITQRRQRISPDLPKLALHPQRPLETQPMKMRTTLSRLPSIRLIAGWCAFIFLLVVIFIFTHR
jgi:hypothetical protein